MSKTTLVATWEFVKQHALQPDGLISFHGRREEAEQAGVTSQGFRKLFLLGFLRVVTKTDGGSKVYYTINPDHSPVEKLAEEDRKPKRKRKAAAVAV